MLAVLDRPWFRHLLTACAAAGMYVLATKFPAYAGPLAALATALPSSLSGSSKSEDGAS